MGAFKYQKRYRELHEQFPKWFSGALKPISVEHITELVKKTRARTMLDFGSGKGYQYLRTRVHEAWGILPHCYDPGVRQLQEKPTGTFNGVICTDVMEHISETDVDAHLSEIIGYVDRSAPGFAYFSICCRPARKSFSDGVNVHLCVQRPRWWENKLARFNRDGLIIVADYETKDDEQNYPDGEPDDPGGDDNKQSGV